MSDFPASSNSSCLGRLRRRRSNTMRISGYRPRRSRRHRVCQNYFRLRHPDHRPGSGATMHQRPDWRWPARAAGPTVSPKPREIHRAYQLSTISIGVDDSVGAQNLCYVGGVDVVVEVDGPDNLQPVCRIGEDGVANSLASAQLYRIDDESAVRPVAQSRPPLLFSHSIRLAKSSRVAGASSLGVRYRLTAGGSRRAHRHRQTANCPRGS